MDESKRKISEEIEKDVLFSHAVKAGKRIYYMDVRKTRKDELYLSITESKKVTVGEGESSQVSFEKHKIFLYREDFGNFIDGLTKTIRYIHDAESIKTDKTGLEADSDIPAQEHSTDLETEDFKIEF